MHLMLTIYAVGAWYGMLFGLALEYSIQVREPGRPWWHAGSRVLICTAIWFLWVPTVLYGGAVRASRLPRGRNDD